MGETLSDRKKRDILRASMEEFVQKGYDGARIERIAQRAKVSTRTLYKHFAGKEALFESIIETALGKLSDIPSTPFQPDVPIETQLIEAVEIHFRTVTDREFLDLMTILLPEYLHDRELAKRVIHIALEQTQQVYELIEGAMENGALAAGNADQASIQLLSMLYGLIFWPILLMGEPDPRYSSQRETIEDCVKTFLSRYRVGS